MKTIGADRGVGRAAGRGLVAAALATAMAGATAVGAAEIAGGEDGVPGTSAAPGVAAPTVPAVVSAPAAVSVPALAPAPVSDPVSAPVSEAPAPLAPAVAPAPAPPPAPAVAPAPAPGNAPAPADVVRETGSWFAHGYTLELRDDGTGQFAVWHGAFDGTRIGLRLIPAPGPATVAEVTTVEQVGEGALAPHEQPGIGGLVTIAFGDVPVTDSAPAVEGVRTAHVEWTSGADRLSADLCPAEGLDAEQMALLRCGA